MSNTNMDESDNVRRSLHSHPALTLSTDDPHSIQNVPILRFVSLPLA